MALPGEDDLWSASPAMSFVSSRALYFGEVFSGELQCSADAVERISLVSPMPQGVLLVAAADFVDHGGAELHDTESIQNGDGFGQFTADRVRVDAEWI